MIILLIVLLYKRKLQLSRKYIDGMENERARLARAAMGLMIAMNFWDWKWT